MRLVLQAMGDKPKRSGPFRTKTANLGACRLSSLDNVAEVIALAEGDGYGRPV